MAWDTLDEAIKTVIFDLGKVIVPFEFSRGYQAVSELCPYSPEVALREHSVHRGWSLLAAHVRGSSILLIVAAATLCSWAQGTRPKPTPRFEDYPVAEIFKGTPAQPILATSEERYYRTVIRNGVSKGWGVEDGINGTEMVGPGPNFAGGYFIITWGCGSPCLMAAIVDARNGRVFPPPFHHGPDHS